MNEQIIAELYESCLSTKPTKMERCSVGQGNYVYIVECRNSNYVIRCSQEAHAYQNSIYWLQRLNTIGISVPQVIANGRFDDFEYLILTYLPGKDLGLVYDKLTSEDKKEIAKEVVHIQTQVAKLTVETIPNDWCWSSTITAILDRAKERIVKNGYFDVKKVERLEKEMVHFDSYFKQIKPIAYLDDISTKNLLIDNGRVSGIIDIDWMEIGDKLTFVALTNMALLNMECDTEYITYLLEEMNVNEVEKKVFIFYTIMFCVDFMGERGTQFMDKKIEVNQQIIDRLNCIYEQLWKKLSVI